MNLEIGHVNVSVKSEQETQDELAAIDRERKGYADDEGIAGCPWEDDKPVVGWHTDSYPFVCVLMLSDCTNMVGGETALQTGTGDILKVRGPQMVWKNFAKIQTMTDDRQGMCSRDAGPIYHTSSVTSSGRSRAHHNGHLISSQVAVSSRRQCLEDSPTDLKPSRVVL